MPSVRHHHSHRSRHNVLLRAFLLVGPELATLESILLSKTTLPVPASPPARVWKVARARARARQRTQLVPLDAPTTRAGGWEVV